MNKKLFIKVSLSIILLILTAILLVMVVKPGAAIFFTKHSLIDGQVDYTNHLIIVPITISESKFNLDSLLVRNSNQIFPRIKTEELPNQEQPAFAVERKSENKYVVRIVPDTVQIEDVDLNQYQILIRPRFITQFWFRLLGIGLGFGFLFSIISLLTKPGNLNSIFAGKWTLGNVWAQSLTYGEVIKKKSKILLRVTAQAVLVVFLYVLMEWVFFVTKPSFMDIMTFGQKLNILFITGLVVWLFIASLIVFIYCLDIIFSSFLTTFEEYIYFIPSSLLLVVLSLLLFDNFTYTIFKFGVSTITSWARVFYVLGLGIVFFYILKSLSKDADAPYSKNKIILLSMSSGLIVLVSVILFIAKFEPTDYSSSGEIRSRDYQTPNIILVSDDGLNAENMSLYGYERDTTPFLDSLSSTSLLMLNNFTNANTSTGSDTALLTGKLPFETRVLYPPNTLEGTDTLEHLPGLLRKLGYQNISLSVPYFVDMGVVNFQNGFDAINGKASNSSRFISVASSYGYNDSAYFLATLEERILTRVFHVLFIEDMENPYLLVTEPSPTSIYLNMNDTYAKLTNSLDQAAQAGQPLFAHIHMVSTHGPKFYSEEQVFSEGKVQDNNWMTDFYDDAILEYDRWVEDLITYLKANGYYENTIIIFYTDHAEGWSAQKRIPLMIHFPNDEHAGEIVSSTQNLDVAPTILDYIGLEKPQWMMGQSLLSDISRTRLIFSAEVDQDVITAAEIVEEKVGPPFYQFGHINVIQCQYLYVINLKTGQMAKKEIPAYVEPCSEGQLDTPKTIWDSAMTLLSKYEFNIPSGWEEPQVYSTE